MTTLTLTEVIAGSQQKFSRCYASRTADVERKQNLAQKAALEAKVTNDTILGSSKIILEFNVEFYLFSLIIREKKKYPL